MNNADLLVYGVLSGMLGATMGIASAYDTCYGQDYDDYNSYYGYDPYYGYYDNYYSQPNLVIINNSSYYDPYYSYEPYCSYCAYDTFYGV